MDNEGSYGPEDDSEVVQQALGENHPTNLSYDREEDCLFWYDGPIVFIGQLPDDPRPRLDICVDTGPSGPPGYPRQMEHRRHQLLFANRDDLEATLHEGCAPTNESYRQALSILVYTNKWTLHGPGDGRAYVCEWKTVSIEDLDPDDLPGDKIEPDYK